MNRSPALLCVSLFLGSACAREAKVAAVPAPAPLGIGKPRAPFVMRRTYAHQTPEIAVEYPYFELASAAASKTINDRIETDLKKEREDFLDAYARDRQAYVREPGDDGERMDLFQNYALNVSCEDVYRTSSLVSIKCGNYTYLGGAHGMSNASAWTFAIEQDEARLLSFDDLFADGGDPRAVVSKLCIERLREAEASMVLDGTVTDVRDALDVFYFGKTGLHFVFDPYAVGYYAQGEFDVALTYESLAAIARPNGPLMARAQGSR